MVDLPESWQWRHSWSKIWHQLLGNSKHATRGKGRRKTYNITIFIRSQQTTVQVDFLSQFRWIGYSCNINLYCRIVRNFHPHSVCHKKNAKQNYALIYDQIPSKVQKFCSHKSSVTYFLILILKVHFYYLRDSENLRLRFAKLQKCRNLTDKKVGGISEIGYAFG